MLPRLSGGQASPDFRGGHGVAILADWKRGERLRLRGFGLILTGARRYQQIEFTEHFLPRAGTAVVPRGDALSGVATAEEAELHRIAVGRAALAGNFDKQASFRDRNRIARIGERRLEHLDTLFQSGIAVR